MDLGITSTITGNAAAMVTPMAPSGDPLSMQTTLGMSTIQVRRLFMIDDVAYRNQAQRPFHINYTGDSRIILNQTLQDSNKSLTPTNLSTVANAFLLPTADSFNANIVGGWQTQRLRFMLYARVKSKHSLKDYLVTGYTDRVGIRPGIIGGSATVDPEMRFYMDKVICLSKELALPNLSMNGMPQVYNQPSIHYNAALIENPNNIQGSTGKTSYFMAPSNLFAAINSQALGILPGMTNNQGVIDTRLSFGANAASIDASQSHAPKFLSDVLVGYRSAQFAAATPAMAQTQSGEDIFSAAFNITQEVDTQINRNPIAIAISNMRGFFGTFSNDFTYRELCTLDPNAASDSVSLYANRAETTKDYQALSFSMNPNDVQDWAGASKINQIATTINNSITAIMMDYGILTLNFMISNQLASDPTVNPLAGFRTGIVATITVCDTLGGPMPQQFIDYVRMRMETEVFRPISCNNEVKITVMGDFNLAGRTAFQIAYDNFPVTPYVVPSFCGSIMAPMYTQDPTTLQGLAIGIKNVLRDTMLDVTSQITGFDPADGV